MVACTDNDAVDVGQYEARFQDDAEWEGVKVSSRGPGWPGGLSKLAISSMRVAFEERREGGRSKAPPREA